MNKFVIGTSLILCSFMSQALESAADQLKYKLARLNSFQASFQQQVTDSQHKAVQQAGEGVLTLKQPSKFRFETISPNPNLLIGDGSNLWHFDPALDQVSIYDAKKEVSRTPFVLLTSTDAKLWAEYNVAVAGNEFVITPKNLDNPVQQLVLSFSGVGLSKMSVLSNDGQLSSFEFIAVQNNVPVDANLFQFVTPEGVETDDQRKK